MEDMRCADPVKFEPMGLALEFGASGFVAE
jgi:hypothetical protein